MSRSIERNGLLTKLNEKYLKILNKLPKVFANFEELEENSKTIKRKENAKKKCARGQ